MVKEAEANASEDKKKKEEAEIKNNANSLISSSERIVKDFEGKISEEDVKKLTEHREALQKAFAEQSYKVKFMNEPDINTHLRITLGRPEQNRIVIDTIKEIASK